MNLIRRLAVLLHSHRVILLPILIGLLLALPSCGSRKSWINNAIVRAEQRLDLPIGKKDYYPLYIEVSEWLGTPYRAGGTTRRGIDCSGFVQAVVRTAYGETLQRSSQAQLEKDVRLIARSKLREGDLLFFTSRPLGKKKKRSLRNVRVSHVGIYLKDGKFAHASTSRGVIVSSLDETYWSQTFYTAGRRK